MKRPWDLRDRLDERDITNLITAYREGADCLLLPELSRGWKVATTIVGLLILIGCVVLLAVHLQLVNEIRDLEQRITDAVTTHTPRLLEQRGIGPDSAAALLITTGGNPDRLHSDALFAALCGVSLIEASSGKTHRRRLNRGDDRQANAALYPPHPVTPVLGPTHPRLP